MEKKTASSTTGAGKQNVCMQKNTNRSILITLHKTQVQVNQRPQHKTIYIEADRREIMEKIDNYITDTQLALAQTGKIKEVSTIYRTKAENKMIEAQAPIVFKNEMKVDLDEIMSQVKALKTGQAIELKPNEKGEYE